jgi:hypothetical protein
VEGNNFRGQPSDSAAAADALIDHGLLRAKRRERDLEVRERTITVRVREQTFRAFAVPLTPMIGHFPRY